MHKPKSVVENETKRFSFEMQADQLIPARRPDPVLINKKKKTCPLVAVEYSDCIFVDK